MAVLIHACCGPCLVYPASDFAKHDMDFSAYFYNPNIHPYKEFRNRLNSLTDYCSSHHIDLIHDPDYGLKSFLRTIIFREKSRCRLCYYMRLKKTAALASEKGYDAFTTTLLYSKFQNHSLLKSISEELSKKYFVNFHYRDYRKGWDLGIDLSIKLGLYRQNYCGCIFSEQERFDNRLKKRIKRKRKLNV